MNRSGYFIGSLVEQLSLYRRMAKSSKVVWDRILQHPLIWKVFIAKLASYSWILLKGHLRKNYASMCDSTKLE